MVNKKNWLGILALVLVFGLAVLGCEEEEQDDDYDRYKQPTLTGTVSITGTAMQGETLTANTVNVGGSDSTWNRYQWKRNGTTDIGYNSNTYYISSDDIGSTITVTVTNSSYSGSITSAPTATVVARPPILYGSINLDNYYPVRSETITATFENSSYGAAPVGTPTWTWYRTNENTESLSSVTNKTTVGNSASYTVSMSDEGYWLWVEISYSGNRGTVSRRTSSTVLTSSSTANVSVSMKAESITGSLFNQNRLTVTLTLSAGRWNNSGITTAIAEQWITMGGSSASFLTGSNAPSKSVSAQGKELVISYTWTLFAPQDANFTATLNNAQLSTMRNYTNVSSTIQAGSPTTASTSQWVPAN